MNTFQFPALNGLQPLFVSKVDQPREYSSWLDNGGYRINAPGIEQVAYVWNPSHRAPSAGETQGTPFGTAHGEAYAAVMSAAVELLAAALCAEALSNVDWGVLEAHGYDRKGLLTPVEFVHSLRHAAIVKATRKIPEQGEQQP